MSLLGWTSTLLTHTTGLVEKSVRRIKHLIPPLALQDGSGARPDPQLVLESTLAKVVLEPWRGWQPDGPRILGSSQGSLAAAQDQLHTDITALVQPSVLEVLSEGMGLGGTWVQLLPRNGQGAVGGEVSTPEASQRATYWYIEQLPIILPSYYVGRMAQ
jgi:hypothetical protein